MTAGALLILLILGFWGCFPTLGGGHPLKPQIDCSAYKKLSDRERPPRCTLEYFPICGSNGQTYTNKCLFCSALTAGQGKIHFKHFGKC